MDAVLWEFVIVDEKGRWWGCTDGGERYQKLCTLPYLRLVGTTNLDENLMSTLMHGAGAHFADG